MFFQENPTTQSTQPPPQPQPVYQGQPMPLQQQSGVQQGMQPGQNWVYLQPPTQGAPGQGQMFAPGQQMPPAGAQQQIPWAYAPPPSMPQAMVRPMPRFSSEHSINRLRTAPIANIIICLLCLALVGGSLGAPLMKNKSYSYSSSRNSEPRFYAHFWHLEKCPTSTTCTSQSLNTMFAKLCVDHIRVSAAFAIITVFLLIVTIILSALELKKKEPFPCAALVSAVFCLLVCGISWGIASKTRSREYCEVPQQYFPSCSSGSYCYKTKMNLSDGFSLIVTAFSFLWFNPMFYLWRLCACDCGCCCPIEIKDDENGGAEEMQQQGEQQQNPVITN